MYWPAGGPRVYSAARDALQQDQLEVSEDGLEKEAGQEKLEANGGFQETETLGGVEGADLIEDEQIYEKSSAESEQGNEPSRTGKAEENDKKNSYYGSEGQLAENITALRLSRSGHLFISITKSTMTIWQTKVYRGL
jgi:hypothetical protein